MAGAASFFIGEGALEEGSDSLSSDSDDTGDSDSLSSVDMSDEDRTSCLSMSLADTDSLCSFVAPDSDDSEEAEGHPPKEEREYPMSPQIKVVSPNFLQVPNARLSKSGGARKAGRNTPLAQDRGTTLSLAPPPPSSYSLRNNSVLSHLGSTISDSNPGFSQDETSISPTLNAHKQGLVHRQWSHAPLDGDFEAVPRLDVPLHFSHEGPRGDSESGGFGDGHVGAGGWGRSKVRMQRWKRRRPRFYDCAYLINPQGEQVGMAQTSYRGVEEDEGREMDGGKGKEGICRGRG